MPSRVLHDSFLTSPSVRVCSPRAQDALPRFILLADDFGCFEAAPRVLLGRGWPYRDDVAEGDIHGWLIEYAKAGMVRVWEAGGRWWGYFVSWWKFQRARSEYSTTNPKGSKRKTPPPPDTSDLTGFQKFPGGNPSASTKAKPRHYEIGDASGGLFPPGNVGIPPGNSEVPGIFPRPQSKSKSQSKTQVHLAQASPTPPHFSDFVHAFDDLFRKAYGHGASWGPKQGKQVKDLLRAHGFDECLRRARMLFESPPDWLARGGGAFDLGTLVANFDRLAAARPIAADDAGPTVVGDYVLVKPVARP